MNATTTTLTHLLQGGSGTSAGSPATVLLDAVSSLSWKQMLVPGVLGWMLLCRTLRFRREEAMKRRFGWREGDDRAVLAKMNVDQAQRIIRDLAGFEIPEFHMTSLQFGLFKTYGIETIAKLLLGTRNLTDPIASRKRYEDTALLISEFLSNPPTAPRTLRGIARMNYLHSKYIAGGQISNADLLYTLSVFVLEPPRFAALYEWRSLNDMEKCAYGVFWKSLGADMGIQYEGYLARAGEWKDGLEFFEDIAVWAKMYEAKTMQPSAIAAKPAEALMPLLTYWVPWFGVPFVNECVCVLMGDRVRDAFLLPEPGVTAAMVVYTAINVRRVLLRYFFLPRWTEVRHLTDEPDPVTGRMALSAPFGNFPFYVKPTVWNRWLSPVSWAIRLYGGKVPGDDPEEFMPQGYAWDDVGPVNRAGMGKAEMEKDVKRMMAADRGGCPFG